MINEKQLIKFLINKEDKDKMLGECLEDLEKVIEKLHQEYMYEDTLAETLQQINLKKEMGL